MKKDIWDKRIGKIYGDVYERFMVANGQKSDEEFERILMEDAQEILGTIMDREGWTVEEFNQTREIVEG